MNQKTKAVLIGALATFMALPAFAQNVAPTLNASASASVNTSAAGAGVSAALQTRITTGMDRANQEINRRITALNDLSTRVQTMVKVSATTKASLASEVSGEIADLTTLKAKIDADTDIATLRSDIKSITDSYRIFLLVIPQGRIEVASDRIGTVADSMTALAGKFQARITSAQTAGSDTAAVSTSLSDMNAKIADANVQATAGVAHVSGLVPDNGDKTVAAANAAAIKQSRADIKVGMQDLTAARADVSSIIASLKALEVSATASTSASVQ